ncbi:MAG: DUF1015 domain-containing protein [Bacillota bacterium]|nr:DUF1015 domain-containing protein [Bacillota bacterium]
MKIFNPADILLPDVESIEKWSVVACDQFTSDLGYWKKVYEIVGNAPSSLKLIIPEAELSYKDADIESEKIYSVMEQYLADGVFSVHKDSYIIVERKLADGNVRRGIVGMVDLEAYDWSDNATAPVRATEHTVEDRLPPRVKVREKALLEMPHIMLFIDDAEDSVIGKAEKAEMIYDFDLMQGGGHITGWLAKDAAAVSASFEQLADASVLNSKYSTAENPIIFAMGDGNHSIAAAKKYWNSVKAEIPEEEWENHPARFALAEVVNIHDKSIVFEPIHKVIFDTDTEKFFEAAESYLDFDENGDREIVLITEKGSKTAKLSGLTIGELIGKCEKFCVSYIEKHGGFIDYIHGDEECVGFATKHRCAGILLPKMEKSELFTSVMNSGSFPKKSFSIGHGPDKRYYLECRKIK